MGQYALEIKGLDKLQAALVQYPKISGQIFANAINASLAVISKTANEGDSGSGGIFRFVTPRSKRTGLLSATFGLPVNSGMKGLDLATPGKLSGWVGPTRTYAIYVNDGTKYIRENPFMTRIVQAAQKSVDNIFVNALDKLTSEIANQSR